MKYTVTPSRIKSCEEMKKTVIRMRKQAKLTHPRNTPVQKLQGNPSTNSKNLFTYRLL